MRTIRFTMFIFYRYYRSGRWEKVPYFHTLCSMSLLLFLHIGALLCLLNKGEMLFNNNKDIFLVKFTTLFIISIFTFWRLVPEQHLKAMEYEDHMIKRGGWYLVLYFILVMALLFLSMIY